MRWLPKERSIPYHRICVVRSCPTYPRCLGYLRKFRVVSLSLGGGRLRALLCLELRISEGGAQGNTTLIAHTIAAWYDGFIYSVTRQGNCSRCDDGCLIKVDVIGLHSSLSAACESIQAASATAVLTSPKIVSIATTLTAGVLGNSSISKQLNSIFMP